MSFDSFALPLFGGVLIGLAVTLMLFLNGRVTGISGILSASLAKPTREGLWRWMFLGGLLAGGIFIQILRPDLLINTSGRGVILLVIAGLLVGYGTVMGSGCTSGHGVCGVSRLSVRSIVATLTFLFFGFLTVQAMNALIGGSQ